MHENTHDDVGPFLVDWIYDQMQIDTEWSHREDRSFAWWPNELCQKVWAEPVRTSMDVGVCCVRAETELFSDVSASEGLFAILGALNMAANLNALVFRSDSRTIVLASSVYAHAQNIDWLKLMLQHAVAIQAAEAQAYLQLIASAYERNELPCPQLAVSEHPVNGPRSQPDEMLNIIGRFYAPAGRNDSTFTATDFKQVKAMRPSPSLMTNLSDHGLTAELPFSGTVPAAVGFFQGLFGREKPKALDSALFQASNASEHPILGSGCLVRLTLPVADNNQELAVTMNAAECHDFVGSHGLGAWCVGPMGLTHVLFIPSAAYLKGLIGQIMWSDAIRAQWAQRFLS
jgi:hypothetical protein